MSEKENKESSTPEVVTPKANKSKAYIWSEDPKLITKFKAVKNIFGDKAEFNRIVLEEGLKAVVNSEVFRTNIANLKKLGI